MRFLSRGLSVWALSALLVAAGAYAVLPAPPKPDGRRYSLQVVSQTVSRLESELTKYENITFQFVANRDLNRVLVDYVQAGDDYDVSAENQRFSNYLEGYAFSDPGLYEAFFLDEANPRRRPLFMGEALPYEFARSFRGSGPYREILHADGRPVWFGPLRVSAGGDCHVALGRRIKHLYSGRPLGVLVMLIREDYVQTLVREYLKENFYFSVGTPRTKYAMVFDQQQRVVSAALKENIGRRADQVLTALGRLPHRPERQGSLVVQAGGEPLLAVFAEIGQTGWRLLLPVAVPFRADLPRSLLRLAVSLALGGVVLGAGVFSGKAAVLAVRADSPRPADPSAAEESEWLAALNEREKEILRLLAQGYTNREISERVFVAEQTVKNYVSAIYHKMGVRDRVQASLKAAQAGLVGRSST
ncbi:MAG TPA: hypothetical protein GXX28_04810 [Firmicutes bacterium]|nr:hypothetical protein [Bacillota bacterium]